MDVGTVSEIDKKRLFSPPINLGDSRGDTRQNHLKINPTLRKYMLSMCPLVVFMIFAAKCSTILSKNLS